MSSINIATRIANAVAANGIGSTAASAAAAAAHAAATEHKPILAERFKTKMCQNHEKHGSCPYETRCMFAHGEQDLRTKEMNLAANLVTEEAIKNFQRDRMMADREAALAKAKGPKKAAGPKKVIQPASPLVKKTEKPAIAAPAGPKQAPKQAAAAVAPIAPVTAAVAELSCPRSPASDSPSTVATSKSPRRASPSSTSTTPMKKSAAVTPTRRYRHDPYAPVIIGMITEQEPAHVMVESYEAYGYYQTPCMCDECVGSQPAAVYKHAAGAYPEPCYCADCCAPETVAERHLVADQILLC
jgi:hypothetical protein